MADPFLSELRMLSFAFPPKGWALCNGQILSINQNQALFSLLGTTYGGNGQTTFALPDLRGRVPIHVGAGHTLGQQGGEQSHTVSVNELPSHLHAAAGSANAGDTVIPTGAVLGGLAGSYGPATNLTTLSSSALASVGGSQPHQNMQPFLTLNFSIALVGIFPSRN
jgi:microcystin-dependent protein